jgi:hypothetical protein
MFGVVDSFDTFIDYLFVLLEVIVAWILLSVVGVHFDGGHQIVTIVCILLVFLEVLGKPAELVA